jgi:hypothetical protein
MQEGLGASLFSVVDGLCISGFAAWSDKPKLET